MHENENRDRILPFWQRLLITVAMVVGASYLTGLLWHQIVSFQLPSYLAGMVGGITALPVWHLLKRLRPSRPE